MKTRKITVAAALALAAVGLSACSAGDTGQRPAGSCVGPHLPGQETRYLPSGHTVVGTDGRNGLAPGDHFTCRAGRVTIW